NGDVSGAGFQDAIDPGGAAVDHLGLLPDLHRVRPRQQRGQELQQPLSVCGHVVERKSVAVGDRLLGTWEEGVVERLQLLHGAPQPLRPSLGLRRQAPRGSVGLQRRERRRQQRGPHRRASFACSRACASTQSATVLWKWRTRTSWSFSGNSRNAPCSSPICVPSSVPQSCSPYSLKVSAAYSCARRSRTFLAGTKWRSPSNTWVLCDVGQ